MENLSLFSPNYLHFHWWRNWGAIWEGHRLRSHNCQGAGLCINSHVSDSKAVVSLGCLPFSAQKIVCDSSLKGHALPGQEIMIKKSGLWASG